MKLLIEHLSCTKQVILYFLIIYGSSDLNANSADRASDKNLSCHELVNVSLDQNCQAVITPETMLTDVASAGIDLIVEVSDLNGIVLADTLTQKYRGIELLARVIDTINGNSCWGIVMIEDKHPPILMCRDTTISCFEPTPLFPDAVDNCNSKVQIELIALEYLDFLCENDSIIGIIRRTTQAVDGWGNSILCDQDINLARETIDSIVCPSDSFIIECCTQLIDPNTGKLVDALWSDVFADIDSSGYPHPLPVIDQSGNSVGLVDPPYRLEGLDTIYFWKMKNRRCNVHVEFHDHLFPDCGYSFRIKRQWLIKDLCTSEIDTCIQYITIQDTLAPVATLDPLITAQVEHTECKAYIDIKSPTIIEECGLKFEKENPSKGLQDIKVVYDIVNTHEPFHGAQAIVTGEVPANGSTHIYLPIGEYKATYIVSDGCYNVSYYYQDIIVTDQSEPVPVCKSTLSVTLNPDSCYARLWAYEFDNGSFDNCCSDLHFVIANYDTIEYWENYWYEELSKCFDHYPTDAEKQIIYDAIDHWINCYVFDDYIDVYDCGTERLAIRIYEACGLPVKDPHIFKGSKHNWFCFNIYDDFACYYKINYDKIHQYGMNLPRPVLECTFDDLVLDEETECGNRLLVNVFQNYDIAVEHNPVCCDFQIDSEHPFYEKWDSIRTAYPAFDTICKRRYTFPHKYNDCWIDVEKIDKIPPVCKVVDDVTVYCDGLHLEGIITIDKMNVSWSDISLASNNNCYNPKTLPWNGLPHGYYSGPMNETYHYSPYSEDECIKQFLFYDNPKPIYCRLWLLLDQFDRPDETFDFAKYFAPVVFEDNCSVVRVDTIEEEHINECGNGFIKRHYTAYDGCENSVSCYQQVVVKPRSDFEVIFPEDTTVICGPSSNLSGTTEALGYPIVSDDDCELVGVNFEDRLIHSYENEVCLKIIREWTVIDWCVYNENRHLYEADVIVDDRLVAGEERPCVPRNIKDNGDGVIHYQQIIYLIDDVPPVIECVEPITINYDQEDCNNIYVDEFLGDATDACTPQVNLYFEYYLDLFQAGDENEFISGEGRRIQHNLPAGIHDAYLIARDECGNIDTCQTTINILDNKRPTPYCHVGIATVIMQHPSQQLTIWASDLDAGSFDNCDPLGEQLDFAFDSTFEYSSRVFTCADVGMNEVRIWVRDQSGNYNYCTTYIEIQEGDGNCQGDSSNSIVNNGSTESMTNGMIDQKRKMKSSQFVAESGTAFNQIGLDELSVSQNSPNPFTNSSFVKIESGKNQWVAIQILNVEGREIHKENINLFKGVNHYKVNGALFKEPGIKYIRVITDQVIVNKKMLYMR